uniref:Uncharacterized protein n=1 Tax=Rhizophora mucronata TaxID=61149 RepID=A0A2P2P0N6_RHIMU
MASVYCFFVYDSPGLIRRAASAFSKSTLLLSSRPL